MVMAPLTEAPGRCEVVLASKGADGKSRSHGTYCLANGGGTSGSCTRPFTVRTRAEDAAPSNGRYRMGR
jgi:hypothetical protein